MALKILVWTVLKVVRHNPKKISTQQEFVSLYKCLPERYFIQTPEYDTIGIQPSTIGIGVYLESITL